MVYDDAMNGHRYILAALLIVAGLGPAAAAETPPRNPAVEIRPATTYVFKTESLLGEIRPDLPKPGVVRCRHLPSQYEVLPEVPDHALLMPEWLLSREKGRQGIFWAPLHARPKVTLSDGSVRFHVTAKQTRDWNMDVTFHYTPRRDWIDFECRIVPHLAIRDFEFFFASYVIEDMESTWVSAATGKGEVFKKIDNRKTVPWGPVYTVTRDAKAKKYLSDGRWTLPPKAAGKELWQDYYFKRPILIAMKESTGLTVVTMVDPAVCTAAGGPAPQDGNGPRLHDLRRPGAGEAACGASPRCHSQDRPLSRRRGRNRQDVARVRRLIATARVDVDHAEVTGALTGENRQ